MNDVGNYDIPLLRKRMLANLGGKAEAYPHRTEERFPRILARLADLWGQPEADAYLNDLLMPDRTDRQGFPDDVASELFRLSMIHGALCSEETSSHDGWSGAESGGEIDQFLDRRSTR
jgi:hypothetical protein